MASSLEDALGILLTTGVALLLIDVSMPGTAGFELARLVRSVIPRFRDIPIFIAGNAVSDLDHRRGYRGSYCNRFNRSFS